VATLAGDITLSGTGVSIDASGGDIAFTVSFPVESVGGKTGTVAFAAGDGIDISGGATNADPITISNTGLLSATAGDGIEITGTQDLTIANTGVLSVEGLTGAVILVSPDDSLTIFVDGNDIQLTVPAVEFPVTSVGGKTGAVTFAAGDGIDISGGAINADPITITNSGLLSATAGDGISVDTVDGVVDISNTGVVSVNNVTGGVTLVSPDDSLTIAVDGNDIQLTVPAVEFPVTSVGGKTGAVTFAAGEGIDISGGATNADPITISSTVIGVATSGTVSQADFIEQTTGPATGQYYKAITVGGMNANGIVVATTSGTPAICYSAWITTVIPTTDTLTFWVAGDPVAIGETWEAHYIIQSFGTAPPP
jgi:hypothetical protein